MLYFLLFPKFSAKVDDQGQRQCDEEHGEEALIEDEHCG
jgi:hypothetical protein